MISQVFKFSSSLWYKAIPIILLWIIGVAYLIQSYGASLIAAFVDVGICTFYLVLGFFLLENIFKFYTPQGRRLYIFIAFPFLISLIVFYSGMFTVEFFLRNEEAYLGFMADSFIVKLFITFLLCLGYALVLLLQTKLESQLQHKEREEQIQKLAKEAELYQLRQQLQPHFLFNSLNSISSLLHRNPERAQEMVIQLSEFLRRTIRKDDQKWISVEEELAFLHLFVGIEKVRFGHRLCIDFDQKGEVAVCKLPPLLVQPLLENAIKHGLYGLLGEVNISVSFSLEEAYLVVRIINPYDPQAGQATGEGFGLEVIKRRLFLLFGRHDLLATQADSMLFKVQIKIPQNYDQYHHH
ncbi:sensor histidine kinase [Belliella pelovolcani]|uniref:Histidine kinase n=1 Tax=Belliella pelovolcani TaxID=529505 RepID=A0A1N7PPH3_9BACT|nr:histidine kinase [Belliella pelovolcani]SIT12554.1 Histidine kinase [Belliella pelovolcani]